MKKEIFIERILLFLALSSIGSLLIITVFIFWEGLPLIAHAGLKNFLLSSHWAPTRGHFGIFAMIVSSIFVTLGALVIGVPLGLACAIILAEFSPDRVRGILKPTLELLAGIPSVVYGFLGVVWLVPLIRDYLGGPGLSVLAGSVILGMGRAIGETMAVIMVAGNALKIPISILDPARTLTANIPLELGYASGRHREALFATGIVLFIIIMILNLSATVITRRR